MEGYLYKRSDHLGKWNVRFLRLEENTLKVYLKRPEKKDEKARDQFDLTGCSVVRSDEKGLDQALHCLELTVPTKGKTYLLGSANKQATDVWFGLLDDIAINFPDKNDDDDDKDTKPSQPDASSAAAAAARDPVDPAALKNMGFPHRLVDEAAEFCDSMEQALSYCLSNADRKDLQSESPPPGPTSAQQHSAYAALPRPPPQAPVRHAQQQQQQQPAGGYYSADYPGNQQPAYQSPQQPAVQPPYSQPTFQQPQQHQQPVYQQPQQQQFAYQQQQPQHHPQQPYPSNPPLQTHVTTPAPQQHQPHHNHHHHQQPVQQPAHPGADIMYQSSVSDAQLYDHKPQAAQVQAQAPPQTPPPTQPPPALVQQPQPPQPQAPPQQSPAAVPHAPAAHQAQMEPEVRITPATTATANDDNKRDLALSSENDRLQEELRALKLKISAQDQKEQLQHSDEGQPDKQSKPQASGDLWDEIFPESAVVITDNHKFKQTTAAAAATDEDASKDGSSKTDKQQQILISGITEEQVRQIAAEVEQRITAQFEAAIAASASSLRSELSSLQDQHAAFIDQHSESKKQVESSEFMMQAMSAKIDQFARGLGLPADSQMNAHGHDQDEPVVVVDDKPREQPKPAEVVAAEPTEVEADLNFTQWSADRVGLWLRGLGAQYAQYEAAFVENGVDGMLLAELDDELLGEVGVAKLLHRRKILAAKTVLQQTHIVQQRPGPNSAASRFFGGVSNTSSKLLGDLAA